MERPKMIIYEQGYSKIIVDNDKHGSWELGLEEEAAIDREWEERFGNNPNATNGPMVRLHSMKRIEDELHLGTGLTDYKHHAITRTGCEDIWKSANPVYVSAMMITCDGFYVFGLRDNCDRGNEQYNIAAGSLHPVRDAADGIPSLGTGLQNEMTQEFGILPDEIGSISPWMAFAIDIEPNPSFLYEVHLDLTREEVDRHMGAWQSYLNRLGKRPEMTAAHFVSQNQIELELGRVDALESVKGVNPYRPKVRALLGYIAGE